MYRGHQRVTVQQFLAFEAQFYNVGVRAAPLKLTHAETGAAV